MKGRPPIRIHIPIRIVVGVSVLVEALQVAFAEPHRIGRDEASAVGVIPACAEVLQAEEGFFGLAGEPQALASGGVVEIPAT